jgi:hypothetical protein
MMLRPLCCTEALAHRARLLAFYASVDPARRTDDCMTRLALFAVAATRGERAS